MGKRKLSKWGKVLECFVKYDHLDEEIFNSDPETWSGWLYEQVNSAGFKLAPTDTTCSIDHARHAVLIRRAIRGVFSNLADIESGSDVAITLHNENSGITYNYDAGLTNKATSITVGQLPVTVVVGSDSTYFFDLGNTGDAGLLFVMNFCLKADEINHVVCCRECGRFFFSKRSGAMYCCANCKTIFNRRKK